MPPLGPYDDTVCSFLGALSERLIKERSYPDVAAFAFFCRKANTANLKRGFGTGETRLGRGVVFHIAPSNIPINFAFSLVFGMLSGNANVVRVPARAWPETDIVCGAINELLCREEFSRLKNGVAMVSYDRDDEITGHFSAKCDARVIWGGDESVAHIRRMGIPPRAVEVTFADRYSICVLGGGVIADAGETDMKRLAENFYNDTYLADQNACSSPNLIVWLDADPKARDKFWRAVFAAAKKYDLQPMHAMDKYTMLCGYLAESPAAMGVTRLENLVYTVKLPALDEAEKYRGRFGLFFEYDAKDINELAPYVTDRWQTLTYYGVEKNILSDFVTGNSLRGIDRIVPVGSALDIGVIWDGYDIVRALSRVLSVV